MEVYIDQIPEGYSFEDYPPDTVFVFEETERRRDPVTHQLIPRKRRDPIYPEDCKYTTNKKGRGRLMRK